MQMLLEGFHFSAEQSRVFGRTGRSAKMIDRAMRSMAWPSAPVCVRLRLIVFFA
jgi:hypothetical protein